MCTGLKVESYLVVLEVQVVLQRGEDVMNVSYHPFMMMLTQLKINFHES